MKYPDSYVHQQFGTFKHGKTAQTLSIELEVEESFLQEDPQLRQGYLKQLTKDAYHTIEGQQVIAQASRVQVEGKDYLLFTSNLDPRLLKRQLQQIVDELAVRLEGHAVSLQAALFRSLLKIEGKDLFLHATKEGEPLGQSDIVARTRQELRPQGRGTTNFLTSLAQYQRKVEMQRSAEKGSDQA